jgi:8-oxo-dGTP pyrophosphatase MutT (NUDIX family)
MGLIGRLRARAVVTGVVCTRALLSQLAFGVNGIVTDEAGRVLLVRSRLSRGWGLPGGGVGAGEAPHEAVLRELREEVGYGGGDAPELIGLYTRRIAWATNLIALYRMTGGSIDFKPNFEIRDVCWADPAALPPGTQIGTRRRLAELTGQIPQQHYW